MATCPNCGEIVMEGDPYCSNCGCTFSWIDDEEDIPKDSRPRDLRKEAWRLFEEGRKHEALDRINEAIELDDSSAAFYNVKGIILEYMYRYDEALSCYDISLSKSRSQVVMNNKARLLERIAVGECNSRNPGRGLDCINEALKLTNEEEDRESFLRTKADILERLERPVDAKICICLASGRNDEADEIERQSKFIAQSTDTLICIAGTDYYDCTLNAGDIVNLIKEPDNEHDSDAIRVEKDGKTAGYVANSTFTLFEGAKSATQIKDMIGDRQKAEVMFKYIDRYMFARIIK